MIFNAKIKSQVLQIMITASNAVGDSEFSLDRSHFGSVCFFRRSLENSFLEFLNISIKWTV